MSGSWRKEQGRDRFFRKAKEEGFRARSAYKLQEIVRKNGLLKPGSIVLDLGAAPGSWTQLASQVVGPKGKVVAVDLSEIAPIPNVTILRGDITDPEVQRQLREALGGPADAVLSDVAPATTGIAVVDHARSIALSEAALDIARQVLKPGGTFVVKVFRGGDFDAFVAEVRRYFQVVKIVVPEATRKESKEAYVVGLKLKAERIG